MKNGLFGLLKPALLMVMVVFSALSGKAQAPDWEQPTGYQYSMTLTGVMVINGEESRDEDDMVAAFVGNEVRGVAQPVYEPNTDRYYIFLSIFSQQVSGEEVTFQMYDATADLTVSSVDTVDFMNNSSLGTISNPQVLKNNNAPTAIEVSTTEIHENVEEGEVALTFTTVDEDSGDEFLYELVSGNGDDHNFLFSISENELLYDSMLNYEEFSSKQLSILVKSTDASTESVTQVVALSLLDSNDGPTRIFNDAHSSATAEFEEHLDEGQAILTFATEDEDANDTFLYELVSGAGDDHNGLFTISGNQLLVATDINYEAYQGENLSVLVKSTDEMDESIVEAFEMTILDVNDAPTAISIVEKSINENHAIDAVFTAIETVDEDQNDTYIYELVAGEGDDDNGLFSISDGNLVVTGLIDFEKNSSINIRLKSTDKGDEWIETTFDWTVNDLNDRPIATAVSENRIASDVAQGDIIGKFSTEDQDSGDSFIYTFIEGGNDNDLFSIDGNRLLANSTFQNLQPPFTIQLKTTDKEGLSIDSEFSFDLAALSMTNQSIAENLAAETEIGTFSTDAEAVAFTYSLEAGAEANDNHHFRILEDRLLSGVTFNYEEKDTYLIRVKSTSDDGFQSVRTFTIEVTDANDAPEGITLSSTSIAENVGEDATVGALATQDQDHIDQYSYELLEGTDSFYIVDNALLTKASFNYEEKSSYSVTVRTTDAGGLFTEEIFTIRIEDAPDVPDDLYVSNLQIDENAPPGTIVGELSTEDQDAQSTFFYQLSGVDFGSNSSFYVQGNRLMSGVQFDHESAPSATIRLSTTDNTGLVLDREFVVNVLDVNETPGISMQEFEVEELAADGTSIGTLQATDVDSNQELIFSVENAEVPFAVSPSGEITVKNGSLLDYESKDFYTLDILVSDNGEPSLQAKSVAQIFLIDVIEHGELPVNNFLSPNEDGKNDLFFIQNVELYQNYTLTVFNQNGNEVYHQANYANQWAGTGTSGKALPAGTYYYRFESAENPIKYKGTLTIAK